MSIMGVVGASSAAYIQQQNTIQSGSKVAATSAQPFPQLDAAGPPPPVQQSGQTPQHHHHHGAGEAGASQAGTAAASGTNILNTLV